MSILPHGETLCAGETFEVKRNGRFVAACLRAPHRVLSTSPVQGGQTEHLRFLLNHQSCEASAHGPRHDWIKNLGLAAYHEEVCREIGIPSGETAMMGTAANMNYAAAVCRRYEDVSVTAVVTAGVQGNAACAGDPAQWNESSAGWSKVPPYGGTINTILLLDCPVTPAALARAVITMTEAKTAALQRLAVASRYSQDLATGTGTDQYCLAAPLLPGAFERSSTSPHSRLGELIGLAVRDATLEALRWQNGLEPSYTRGLFHALGRFGLTEESLLAQLEPLVSPGDFALLRKNSKSVFYEPSVAAAAYAIAAVWDRVRYGVIPPALAGDVMRQQAASIACTLACRPDRWSEYWRQLEYDPAAPLAVVVRALALGWSGKWT